MTCAARERGAGARDVRCARRTASTASDPASKPPGLSSYWRGLSRFTVMGRVLQSTAQSRHLQTGYNTLISARVRGGCAMVSPLFFSPVGLVALAWLGVMLHGAWPSAPTACPTTLDAPHPHCPASPSAPTLCGPHHKAALRPLGARPALCLYAPSSPPPASSPREAAAARWIPPRISALTRTVPIPTVSLDVISLVASSCGYYRGQIEHRVAHVIRGARGDTERARGTSTTPPSAARSARCAHAGVSLQASTAAPEALHRSGTTPRSGTTRWSHTGGETTQSLHNSS